MVELFNPYYQTARYSNTGIGPKGTWLGEVHSCSLNNSRKKLNKTTYLPFSYGCIKMLYFSVPYAPPWPKTVLLAQLMRTGRTEGCGTGRGPSLSEGRCGANGLCCGVSGVTAAAAALSCIGQDKDGRAAIDIARRVQASYQRVIFGKKNLETI